VMTSVFQSTPDIAPFVAEQPRTPLTTRNSLTNAADTAHLDLHDADLNDDDEMNNQLWKAIKGPKTSVVASARGAAK